MISALVLGGELSFLLIVVGEEMLSLLSLLRSASATARASALPWSPHSSSRPLLAYVSSCWLSCLGSAFVAVGTSPTRDIHEHIHLASLSWWRHGATREMVGQGCAETCVHARASLVVYITWKPSRNAGLPPEEQRCSVWLCATCAGLNRLKSPK